MCPLLSSGDGAGVGKGRTIAGKSVMKTLLLVQLVSLVTSYASCTCRYYLSKLFGRKKESCLVSGVCRTKLNTWCTLHFLFLTG